MQAIITKFHGPTNYRGSRYSAKCERGSIVIEASYDQDSDGNHVLARKMLCEKFAREDREQFGPDHKSPWLRPMVHGQIPTGEEVHVFVS